MACKLYLNKAVRKEKDSALPAPLQGAPSLLRKRKKGQTKRQNKGGSTKGPSLPLVAITVSRIPAREQAIWPQPWFPRVSKPPGKYRSARPLQSWKYLRICGKSSVDYRAGPPIGSFPSAARPTFISPQTSHAFPHPLPDL